MVANAPSLDIARWLVTQNIGPFAGLTRWSIHTVMEPDGPGQHADVITIYDTGGGDIDTDELDLASPTFQVRVRCSKYSEGHAKARAIRDLLLRTAPIVTAGSTFVLVQLTSDVTPIGMDENQRHLLTANYRAVQQL